jgi:hypothetical protein
MCPHIGPDGTICDPPHPYLLSMTTSASLDSPWVRLDAGDEAVIPLQIRNTGNLVEGYHLEIVGVPGEWTTVEPRDITLYPGATTTATLAVRPPRSSSVPAGELRFGVRVTPTERPDEAVVPEGVIEVLPFLETSAELTPRTSRGRRGGRHQVAIDNRGNVPVTVVLTGTDPAEALDIATRPEGLSVNPGHAAFSEIRVRPEKKLWRGAALTHPFTIVVSPNAGPPVSLEGTYLQETMIPKWLPKALLALLLLLLALAAIWFGLLKPTIRSAAKDAVDKPAQQAQQQAAAAQEQANKAGAAAQNAAGAATDANKAADKAAALVNTPRPRTISSPLSSRLELQTPVHTTGNNSFVVPSSQTLELTDLVLENPQGDFGTIRLSLNGNTLFFLALENFRDVDYHFVSPIRATAGQQLLMTVQCNKVGAPPDAAPAPTQCDTAVYFGGTITKPLSP